MSKAYVPDAIRGCWNEVKKAIPSAQLSGIYANKPGYHNCRAQLPGGDYSVQRSADRQGDAWAAGALDITLGQADMKRLTQRLIDATRKGDRRLRAVREFFGTINGTSVTGMDVPGKYFVTSDPSHLWHVHLSSNRSHADDKAAWLDVAAVLTGGAGGGTPTPIPPQESDVPKQVVLSKVKAMDLAAGGWKTINWTTVSDKKLSGGTSAVIGGRYYVATLDLTLDKLPLDGNVYLRYQTVDGKTYKQVSLSAISEQRASTGASTFSITRAAYCPKGQYLRALVAATHKCKVTAATWSVLYW